MTHDPHKGAPTPDDLLGRVERDLRTGPIYRDWLDAVAAADAIATLRSLAAQAQESPAGSAPCGRTSQEFLYALNAMENAAQSKNPAKHDYGAKRKRVLAIVAALERELAEARADARRKALNDAIKVCDNLVIEHVGNSALTLDQCAEAIRTLATERKETEG